LKILLGNKLCYLDIVFNKHSCALFSITIALWGQIN